MNDTTRPLNERIFDNMFCDSEAFDRVDDVWPDRVNDIGYDWHDNSLEVRFADVPADFAVTADDLAKLTSLGFTTYWLNYRDGTLQVAGMVRDSADAPWVPSVGERKPGRSRPSGCPLRRMQAHQIATLTAERDAAMNDHTNLKQCWDDQCAHVHEACKMLGVDTDAIIGDSWTLREWCRKVVAERDLALVSRDRMERRCIAILRHNGVDPQMGAIRHAFSTDEMARRAAPLATDQRNDIEPYTEGPQG